MGKVGLRISFFAYFFFASFCAASLAGLEVDEVSLNILLAVCNISNASLPLVLAIRL